MAGIEPASKKGESLTSTCLAVCFSECSSSQQQDLSHFFAIDFASLALRKRLRSLFRYLSPLLKPRTCRSRTGRLMLPMQNYYLRFLFCRFLRGQRRLGMQLENPASLSKPSHPHFQRNVREERRKLYSKKHFCQDKYRKFLIFLNLPVDF